MRRRCATSEGRDRRGEISGVCDESGRPKRRGRLGRAVYAVLTQWDQLDRDFISATVSTEIYAVRQKSLAFDETYRLEPLVLRQQVAFYRVLGYATDLNRSRPLGFLLLHSGKPLVNHYATYVAVAYSGVDQIGAKEVTTLYTDQDVVLLKLGHSDYLLGWRRPTREHYSSGSAGAVHRDQDGAWKDGF